MNNVKILIAMASKKRKASTADEHPSQNPAVISLSDFLASSSGAYPGNFIFTTQPSSSKSSAPSVIKVEVQPASSILKSDNTGLSVKVARPSTLIAQVEETTVESISPGSLRLQDNSSSIIKGPIFKDPNFQHSIQFGKKKRGWKSLKQILAAEKMAVWPETHVTYSGMEAPLSRMPAKKYSDISGLPALYTDPQTKLRYATADEFTTVRSLPSDIVAGLLALRKAPNPM